MTVVFDRLRRLAQRYRWWWMLLPFVASALFLFFVCRPALYLVSPDQPVPSLIVAGLTDREVGGFSDITVLTNSSQKIAFKYTLKEGFLNPYAHVRFSAENNTFFDLAPYDYVKINIRSSAGKRVPFYLASEVANHSNPERDISYRYSLNNLNVNPEETEMIVSFDQLHTPDWWYISNDKTESDFGAPDFSKTKYLFFASCINLKKNIEDEIVIKELSFHVTLWPYYLMAVGCSLLYYAGFFALLYRKKEVVAPINFNYEKVTSRNHQDKEEEVVFNYLDKHFMQQELTVIDVQNATGIHERKISAIVKKKKDVNFKQFLNDLRITEAKRLLSQTALPISEIAFQVGYSNASHFNRVFKSMVDCSPNDYRKEHS